MMKFISCATLALFLLGGAAIFLRAQTPAPSGGATSSAPPQHDPGMISFLTPEQQKQYAEARAKALVDNPALKSEGEGLMREVISRGGQLDKELEGKVVAHRTKLRQAMLKEDPTLKPVFAEIDEHLAAVKSQQLGGVQNSGPKNGAK